jgi:phosphotransferase family enzyme
VTAWTDPTWLATAHSWIRAHLDRLGIVADGPIEQPHVRPWSTVMRVPTADGFVWFKANMAAAAHEAVVVDVLSRRRPDCVDVPLALDLDADRGWMLLPDAGSRLREVIQRDRDLDCWNEILARYGGLQIDASADVEELIARGVPDCRLATLADRFDALVEDEAGLPGELRQQLAPHRRSVREQCRRLAAVGIPETIEHGDLHDGQVFVRAGGTRFADWGDSHVSHPFFTMSATLEGRLAWGLDDVQGSQDTRSFAASYLAPFQCYATRSELEAAFATALRLGWVCHGCNTLATVAGYDPDDQPDHLARAAVHLRMFLDPTS